MLRARWVSAGLVLVGMAAIAACASVLGIEDRLPFDLADGGADSGDDGATAAACSTRAVDDASGVFVTLNGVDSATCGERATPCRSVQSAVAQAKLLKRKTVYVARGTYVESVRLEPGVAIEGGWDTVSASWVPICGSDQLGAVKLHMPDSANATVTADFGVGSAGLRILTIEGKAAALPGETLYGVFVRDATFTMESVIVGITNGGVGASGGAGDAGVKGSTKCGTGTGGVGASGGDAPPGPPGSFARDGFVPGNGLSGGADGGVGTSGACNVPPDNTIMHPATVCGGCLSICVDPLSGCGGGPGAGGTGGVGGGSSIALFAWNAMVTIDGGSLQSGSGGRGGNGGIGGAGGSGGDGTVKATPYYSTCTTNGGPGDAGVCAFVAGEAAAATGSNGGAGGLGGHGGGGAGGSSYAIFSGGGGTITLANRPALSHGDPGAGGVVSGITGQAADRGP